MDPLFIRLGGRGRKGCVPGWRLQLSRSKHVVRHEVDGGFVDVHPGGRLEWWERWP